MEWNSSNMSWYSYTVLSVCSNIYNSSGYDSVNEIEHYNHTVEETYDSKYDALEEMNITRYIAAKDISEDTVGMTIESDDEYIDNEITTEENTTSENIIQGGEVTEEGPIRPEHEPEIGIAKIKESSQSSIVLEAVQKPLVSTESSSSSSGVSVVLLIAALNMSI